MSELVTSQGTRKADSECSLFFFWERECLSEKVQNFVLSRVLFTVKFFLLLNFLKKGKGKEKSTDSIQGWYQIDFLQSQATIKWIPVGRSSDSFHHFTVQMVRKEPLCPTRMIIKQYNTVCFSGWNSSLEYSGVFTLSVYSTEHHKSLQGWRSRDSLLKNSGRIRLININATSANRTMLYGRVCKLKNRRFLPLYLVDEWDLNISLVSFLINMVQVSGLFRCT